MDSTSQRVVDEEVESHAPSMTKPGDRREPAPPVPDAPATFQQMAKFFRQMVGVMLPPPPPHQKSHMEKLRKFRAVDFLGKREDDSVTA